MIDGKPIEMSPGTCSNPEPPASIVELPLGHLDLAWYMLAEAEITSCRDVGIAKSLRARLKDGPILFMEVALRNRWIVMDVLRSDSSAFARHLPDYLAGMQHLRRQDKATRDAFSPLAPPRGEPRPLSVADLIEPIVEEVAADAIIAFGVAAVLRGAVDPVVELQKNLIEAAGENYPGKCIVDEWRGVDAPLAQLDRVITNAVSQMRSAAHLEPRRLWEVGLRLFEKIRQSNFRKALVPLLANWLEVQWKRIVVDETFRLLRPMQTVPAIEATLAQMSESEAFIASLLLTSAEAVGSPLATEYDRLLREISVANG